MKQIDLIQALNVARATKMEPKEYKRFNIDEEYFLKVYCYCGQVRRYSLRDDEGCLCSSGTEEGLIYNVFTY